MWDKTSFDPLAIEKELGLQKDWDSIVFGLFFSLLCMKTIRNIF